MKSEARILVSRCGSSLCIGVILRGNSIDGAVIGDDCNELCSDLEKHGYAGETRFSLGPCTCGLPLPPRLTEGALAWTSLLEDAVNAAILIRKYYTSARGEHMRRPE